MNEPQEKVPPLIEFFDRPKEDPDVSTTSEVVERKKEKPSTPARQEDVVPLKRERVEPEKDVTWMYALIVLVFLIGVSGIVYILFFCETKTFPSNFAEFTQAEARLAKIVRSRVISKEEIQTGVLRGDIQMEDIIDSMVSMTDWDTSLIIIPIYFGPEFALSMIAFNQDGVSSVVVNPTVHMSSGKAKVKQQPHFCPDTQEYTLPTKVVISGSSPTSTSLKMFSFEGSRAALVYTLVMQLSGIDICYTEWI